ncbi:MAG: hypothetical protein F9K45_02780 [Melioribacteraceae bacterium]|nr:MAG: hypothetical protein F9K45_02780 [Melioribacteraceae bacterium]
MLLTLVINDNCKSCVRAEKDLQDLAVQYPSILLRIVNINSFYEKKVAITPALFLNEELFSYGDIDKSKLIAIITD